MIKTFANFNNSINVAITKLTHFKIFVFYRNYNPRRAILYTPGDDLRKLNKAINLNVDCVAMDCEDGVAESKKKDAREIIRSVLDKGRPQHQHAFDWAVRVNSIDSGLCTDDIHALLTGEILPDTILLPKVENLNHIKKFSEDVNKYMKEDKKINFIVFIESTIGFLNIVEICKSALTISSKIILSSLVFGCDDFCANIGATRTENSNEILYARQKLVLVAKAFNLQAIDMVYIKYQDNYGLKRQSEEGMHMGYTGKQVIHPSQVPIVQRAFMPSDLQVKWAKDILNSFKEHQKIGKGAFNFKGSMIDMPTVKQAQNILALASLASE